MVHKSNSHVNGIGSLNGLTGNITLTSTGGTVTITPSGSTIDLETSGGGGTPASPTNSIQYNNAGNFGGSANLTFDGSLETITANALGVTQDLTKGLKLTNTTAAAAGAQQISPAIHWSAHGWKTTATAASQVVDFYADILPVQGTTNPSARWRLRSSINGGAYSDLMLVNSTGSMSFTGTVISTATRSNNYQDSSGNIRMDDNGLYFPNGSTLADTSSNVFVPGALTIGGAYTLPSIDGSAGYVPTTDGAGHVTWQAGSGGGGSPGGLDTQVQWNNAGSFDGIADSVVSSDLLGLGMTPTKRLSVKAVAATLAPPTGLNITPSLEVTADNPTAVANEVVGPNDSSGASLAAPTQNDGAGSYFADGSTNITYNIYAYVTVLGINYYTGTASTNTFTDNSDSSNFSVGLSWSPVTGATGYIVQATGSANTGNPNFVIDAGNVTSFSDDGAQSTSASVPPLFSTICFYPPITPVANDPSGLNVSAINFIGSGFPDDGTISSIVWNVYAYDNQNPTIYYSNSFSTTTYNPTGTFTAFTVDLAWASGGTQNGFKIVRTINFVAGGTQTDAVDVGNVTSYTDSFFTGGSATVTPTVSSFTTTTTRNYQASGFNLLPVTTYSPSNYPYSVTDTAPSTGYVIVHTITYATSVNAKVLGSYDGQSLTASFSTTATSFLEGIANVFTGDATITPFHYGTLAAGQTIAFKLYSSDTTPFTYYSTLYDSAPYTFANDGLYYVLTLGWVNGGGTAVRFLRDTGSGFNEYVDTSGTSFIYYSYPPMWISGSTVMPDAVEDTAVIFQNAAEHLTDAAQVIVKSTGSTPYMRVDFKDNLDATKMSIGNDASFGMKLFSSGSYVDFYGAVIGLLARIGSQFTTLNFPFSASYYFQVNRGGSGTMFKVLSNVLGRTRAYFGNDTTDNFGAVLTLTPDNSADEGLYINHPSSNGTVLRVGNSSSTGAILRANGKLALNRTIIGSGWLTIGAGDLSNHQIQFDDTTTISSNPGGLTRKAIDGGLRYVYTSTATRIITDTGTDIATNTIPRMATSSSQMVASNISDTGTQITFSATPAVLFSNGFSVSSGKNVTTNGGSYLGGMRATLGSVTASTSLNIANHSPAVEFTGSTSGRTLTLPTAASIGGTIFEIFNRATVSVTVATTSSQNINIGTGTVTTLVLQPGDSVKFVATASSTWDAFYYSQNISLPANGGTGNSSYAVGDLLYASGATTLSKLADIATGNALISGGVTTAPSYGKIGLTTHVSGTLPVANGGTGVTSFTPTVCLFDHFADANNSGTGETDLYSDTIAAAQLATNGDKLLGDYGGVFSGAVSATQQLRAYFGGTLVFDSGALAIGVATPSWDIYLTLIRVSSSVVRCVASITTSSAALSSSAQYTEVTGLTLANTQILKITGTAGGVAGASSQITAKLSTVSYQGHA